MIIPIQRVWNRYELDKGESDVAAFHTLLYVGELVSKLLVAGLLAGLREDRDRRRFGHAKALIKADGIGDWATTLDTMLTGPSSQDFVEEFTLARRELTERVGSGAWQYEAMFLLQSTIHSLGIPIDPLPQKVAARQWIATFALLRNKTRGHGAPTAAQCSSVIKSLEESIKLLCGGLSIFRAPWAYLHRNLSGKYRIVPVYGDSSAFDYLKRGSAEPLQDGVYIYAGSPLRVELLHSDVDLSDFLVPNGQFRGSSFEILSYVTNATRRVEGTHFLVPDTPLPASETDGRRMLDVQGNLFGNLPPVPEGYVERAQLEESLVVALQKTRHEIVTLSGPGGIGKTSAALAVLHGMSGESSPRFANIIWFSARDIDLLPSGPKTVRPQGLSIADFARDYVRLVSPPGSEAKEFRPVEYLASQMESASEGATLFVFDNFETVISPAELFRWIDTYVRPPNKVLITTRTRDFAGDLPIEVPGMRDEEATVLVKLVSSTLGIVPLISDEYQRELLQESGGHPYVIKILLGEVARNGRAAKPERIIASQDQILQALFERTFATLSPAAKRVFMLLSNWRSVVPSVGVEAVALRSAEERFDVRAAIDELRRLSFLEEFAVEGAEETMLSVPLAAMTFGRRKLNASPLQATIEADTKLLQLFGATRRSDVQAGVAPRVRRLVRELARRAEEQEEPLASYLPMLQFLGDRVPPCWLDIADLFQEEGSRASSEIAANCLRRLLESSDRTVDRREVWHRLARLMSSLGDEAGQVHALVEYAESASASLERVSGAVNEVNGIFASARSGGRQVMQGEEHRALVGKIVRVFERHYSSMGATDLSRLAWAYLRLDNEGRAIELVKRGLALDPNNDYCRRLAQRLSIDA